MEVCRWMAVWLPRPTISLLLTSPLLEKGHHSNPVMIYESSLLTFPKIIPPLIVCKAVTRSKTIISFTILLHSSLGFASTCTGYLPICRWLPCSCCFSQNTVFLKSEQTKGHNLTTCQDDSCHGDVSWTEYSCSLLPLAEAWLTRNVRLFARRIILAPLLSWKFVNRNNTGKKCITTRSKCCWLRRFYWKQRRDPDGAVYCRRRM